MQSELNKCTYIAQDCSHAIRSMRKWQFVLALMCSFGIAPLLVIVGSLFDSSSAYLSSTAFVVVALIPFVSSFERRRPYVRELVVIAILCAIAVTSRIALSWLPSFKPTVGIIMISGIALGAPTGFLVGALSALVSNMFLGQGLWTLWQMLSFGIAGMIFGLLADGGFISREGFHGVQRIVFSFVAAAFVIVVVGPILDTSTLFFLSSEVTFEQVLLIYTAGLSSNAIQAVCVFLTMLFFANPILECLARVKMKYGVME